MKRKTASPNSEEPVAAEFVYNCYSSYSDFDGEPYNTIKKHRIVKRTKKRVYVDAEQYEKSSGSDHWYDYVQSSFVLDRDELETIGKADRAARDWWNHRTYYTDPSIFFAEKSLDSQTDCFRNLGVSIDATVQEVQAAYR